MITSLLVFLYQETETKNLSFSITGHLPLVVYLSGIWFGIFDFDLFSFYDLFTLLLLFLCSFLTVKSLKRFNNFKETLKTDTIYRKGCQSANRLLLSIMSLGSLTILFVWYVFILIGRSILFSVFFLKPLIMEPSSVGVKRCILAVLPLLTSFYWLKLDKYDIAIFILQVLFLLGITCLLLPFSLILKIIVSIVFILFFLCLFYVYNKVNKQSKKINLIINGIGMRSFLKELKDEAIHLEDPPQITNIINIPVYPHNLTQENIVEDFDLHTLFNETEFKKIIGLISSKREKNIFNYEDTFYFPFSGTWLLIPKDFFTNWQNHLREKVESIDGWVDKVFKEE